jgi:hypothetical protein
LSGFLSSLSSNRFYLTILSLFLLISSLI